MLFSFPQTVYFISRTVQERNGILNMNQNFFFFFFFFCLVLFLQIANTSSLIEESQEHTRNVLATGLLMVHDTGRGREDNVTKLTRGKQLDGPVLELTELNGVARADDTALVQTARK